MKAPSYLPEGPRKASLKSKKSTSTYKGPSIICGSLSDVTKSSDFIAVGTSKSTFGKLWYLIRIGDETQFRWVPARHISLGEPIANSISANVIPLTELRATTNLNVRKCPHLGCPGVGTLSKDSNYSSTKQAENGWYLISLGGGKEGWASGKYFAVTKEPSMDEQNLPSAGTPDEDSEEKLTALDEPIAKLNAVRDVVKAASKLDPCKTKKRITQYKDKHVWQLKQELILRAAPHAQCGIEIKLSEGKALVPIGETDHYYLLAAAPEDTIEAGYFHKALFTDQYELRQTLNKNVDVFSSEMVTFLHEREDYWDSFEFIWDSVVESVSNWIKRNTAAALCILALILGAIPLCITRLRHLMLRADQWFIRTGYFFVRSNEFWKMMRRLLFIVIVSSIILIALTMYVLWLYQVASQRQMIMGLGSLGLMSLSIGMFGARVAGFFTGVLLFFLSLIEFMLFVAFLCLLFLLPSLILLASYYWTYSSEQRRGDRPQTPFNRVEIERIHEKIFRLRNFYPETIIGWARRGGIKDRWQSFKDVMQAKSSVFDPFFNDVNKKANESL